MLNATEVQPLDSNDSVAYMYSCATLDVRSVLLQVDAEYTVASP